MTSLGTMSFTSSFPKHGWGAAMNQNFLKMATVLHPSVVSRTTALPSSSSDGTAYIDPSTGDINVWFDGEWNTITPKIGVLVFVEEDEQYVHYDGDGWLVAIDLNATQGDIPRTLAFYAPGRIRTSATLFRHIAAMEFTIPAGADGSAAKLDVAPSGGDVTFNVTGGTGSGTVTFAEGSTEGTFSFSSEVVVNGMEDESGSSGGWAETLTVVSPPDIYGAEGLSLSFRGMVRALAAG